MRIFASGPRVLNGFVRFGVSAQAPRFGRPSGFIRVTLFVLLIAFWVSILFERRDAPPPQLGIAPITAPPRIGFRPGALPAPMPSEVTEYPPAE